MNLSRSLKSIVLSVAALGFLFGAPVVTEAALPATSTAGTTAKPTKPPMSESVYLSKSTTLVDRWSTASGDLSERLGEAVDDIYQIFDPSWQAQVLASCDDTDAIYQDARHLRPPADYQAVNRHMVRAFKESKLACDELRLFVEDYDSTHLENMTGYITTATTEITLATDELNTLADERGIDLDGDTGIDL